MFAATLTVVGVFASTTYIGVRLREEIPGKLIAESTSVPSNVRRLKAVRAHSQGVPRGSL